MLITARAEVLVSFYGLTPVVKRNEQSQHTHAVTSKVLFLVYRKDYNLGVRHRNLGGKFNIDIDLPVNFGSWQAIVDQIHSRENRLVRYKFHFDCLREG